ncbi:hypothetical protein ACIRSS_24040 [Amycolatopsis sp. NPDC101161]|uniref:hypothetical protein n=1 Tax=Amycolatopsis sp. NPDC101161 TaxID=3363940 RepID=UPI00382687AF
MADKTEHPRNVYLAEQDLIGPLDSWLSTCFAPHRLAETIDDLYAAQPELNVDPGAAAAVKAVEKCDRALERHRAALEAGADIDRKAEVYRQLQLHATYHPVNDKCGSRLMSIRTAGVIASVRGGT